MAEPRTVACPTCKYSLDGLRDHTACPECGEAFHFAAFSRPANALPAWKLILSTTWHLPLITAGEVWWWYGQWSRMSLAVLALGLFGVPISIALCDWMSTHQTSVVGQRGHSVRSLASIHWLLGVAYAFNIILALPAILGLAVVLSVLGFSFVLE